MAAVMIGIDPHKGSHTAVAIGSREEPLGRVRVRACPAQAGQLVAWAAAWPERTWAVEGAAGLGHLLAQQLVAAGERVLDVPPKLAARVRLLQAADTSKNDPNDAQAVAIAALRSTAPRQVAADDHAAVLKVWAKRHRDLSRCRNQAACRIHAVLASVIVWRTAFVASMAGDNAWLERAVSSELERTVSRAAPATTGTMQSMVMTRRRSWAETDHCAGRLKAGPRRSRSAS